MLVLSRKLNETIVINGDIRVTVVAIRANQVRLGIEAPESVAILREELRDRVGVGEMGELPRARPAWINRTGSASDDVAHSVDSRSRRRHKHLGAFPMMRSILIGIANSASDIAAQELGVRWAERFDARLTAIRIIDGHRAERAAVLVSAGASHHSADPFRIADNRPMVDAGDWHVEKQFGERCRKAGAALELIGDVASPHVQILLESQNHDIVLLGQRSGFEFGRERDPGQTVARIIQNCPRPVVVVPANSDGGESIVVAYDGSLQASRALWAFEASGLGRGARIHVLTVRADRQTRPVTQSARSCFSRATGSTLLLQSP